jgi:hypothetical protein
MGRAVKRLTADEFVNEIQVAPIWNIVMHGDEIMLLAQYGNDEPAQYLGPNPLETEETDLMVFMMRVEMISNLVRLRAQSSTPEAFRRK